MGFPSTLPGLAILWDRGTEGSAGKLGIRVGEILSVILCCEPLQILFCGYGEDRREGDFC